MSPEFINTLGVWLEVAVTVMGAMLFALWAGTVVWTINDIRARSWDVLAMILAAALVVLVPFAGLVVYILVRPRESLADTYNRALEEEALLREANVSVFCTGCSRPVRDAWVFCPHCRVQLLQACPACGHAVRREWAVCAQCGTGQGGQPTPQYPQAGADAESWNQGTVPAAEARTASAEQVPGR